MKNILITGVSSGFGKAMAQALAAQYGISWLPSDFKKKGGYQRSIVLSREYDLYRQNFCGCVYSRLEAERRMAQE